QQEVPVHPTESELAPVVDGGVRGQAERTYPGHRVPARQGLGGVVEVDEHSPAVAGFDEAVGVPVEACGHRPAVDVLQEVAGEHLDREVRDRPGLRRGNVAGVAEGEDVVVPPGQQRVLVHRYQVQLVAQARAGDVLGAHVQRYRDQQV